MLLKMLSPILLLPALAAADVVVLDTFSDGGRTNGTDPQDLAWYVSTGSTPLSVAADAELDPSSPTHNVLIFNNSNGGLIHATLPSALTVTPTTSIKLTLSFRDVGGTGLKIGFFYSNDTPAPVSDAYGASGNTLISDDIGFYVNIDQTASQIVVDKGADGPFWGNRENGSTVTYSALGASAHTFVMMLTYNAETGGTLVTTSIDGGSVLTHTWTMNTFNELIFSQKNSPGVDLRFDNIQIETLAVPEPAAFGMITLTAGGWLVRRVRR